MGRGGEESGYEASIVGTRCRDVVKVLCSHSHLVQLVFESSIPTCAFSPSKHFSIKPAHDDFQKCVQLLLGTLVGEDSDLQSYFVSTFPPYSPTWLMLPLLQSRRDLTRGTATLGVPGL